MRCSLVGSSTRPVHKRTVDGTQPPLPSTTQREQYQRFTRPPTTTNDPDNDLLIRRSSVRARRGPPRVCAGQKPKIPASCSTERSRRRAKWHILCHLLRDKQSVHFESAGHRFGPGNAKRCLRRSAAWSRPRDLPGTALEQWPCGTFLAHRDRSTACFKYSGSLPQERTRWSWPSRRQPGRP